MASKKALLIGSPYGKLQGQENDVEMMARALGDLGFDCVRCTADKATKQGILTAWRGLIHRISPGDAAVVYYSGHGGLVEAPITLDKPISTPATPWKHQFIVPVDFNETTDDEFRGILDVELTYLTHAMTDKTSNVTVILDCCHAGRMVRDPGLGDKARAKYLPDIQYHNLSGVFEQFKQSRVFRNDHVDDNPLAVRVAGAAMRETAWEHINEEGKWCGMMTQALTTVFSEIKHQNISWRNAIWRIRELVGLKFPYQHPEVEGPSERHLLSLKAGVLGAFHIANEHGGVFIHAGKVSGVRDGNIYAVMPYGSIGRVTDKQLAEASVTYATAFKAEVKLVWRDSDSDQLPTEGALAFLQQGTLYRWPIKIPSNCPEIKAAVEKSKYVRSAKVGNKSPILASIVRNSDSIMLHNKYGFELRRIYSPSPYDTLKLVQAAEQLARAHHLLTLRSEFSDEVLHHGVDITLGLVEKDWRPGRTVQQDGRDNLVEGDRIYIHLANKGDQTVYVWVFDINIAGRISIVSRANQTGIELPVGRGETLGVHPVTQTLRGLPVSWPSAISKTQPLEETLFFVLSSEPVDLINLASARKPQSLGGANVSRLEQLVQQIVTGGCRTATVEYNDSICYTTISIPFLLHPKI